MQTGNQDAKPRLRKEKFKFIRMTNSEICVCQTGGDGDRQVKLETVLSPFTGIICKAGGPPLKNGFIIGHRLGYNHVIAHVQILLLG